MNQEGAFRPRPPAAPQAAPDSARLLEQLRRIRAFRGLSDEQLLSIGAICRPRTTYRGETLLEEGDRGREVFLVLTGKVGIHLESISPYLEIGIARLGPGEMLGEMSVIWGEEHSATVVAMEPCELLVIPAEDFCHWLEEHPAGGLIVMRNTAGLLSRRLRAMNRRVLNLIRSKYY